MRCPKCGYISFDRQRSCGKCSNDLTAVAEQITGTVGKAAAPFFLGAVLGQKKPSFDEPSPTLDEEEEPLSLDELDAETLPTAEEELDFAGMPLDEDDLQEQPLPSLGLEDIDVSDLVPPQEEAEEELELSLGSEQEEPERSTSEPEEEDSLSGIEFSGFEFDDTLNVAETEQAPVGVEDETREPPADAEEDDIIDLSSLMNFDEAPAQPAAKDEEHDIMDLSLGEEPEELHLSLEEDEHTPVPDDAAKKSANTVADIPDLGLTLDNDDE